MKRHAFLLAVAASALAHIFTPAFASPVEERRLVDLMLRWVESRERAAVRDAEGLIVKLRPDLAGQPSGPVFDYVLELAARHQPGARSGLEAAFDRLRGQGTQGLLHSIRQALEQYRMNRGDYPEAGARALTAALTDRGNPYLEVPPGYINGAGELVDGWGLPISLRANAGRLAGTLLLRPESQERQGRWR
jgi:hypothetical protein